VIIEEWRLGQNAQRRLLNKQLPILLYNSLYAKRLPIGTRQNIEEFTPDRLVDFYRTWYRPDLMAVVAVGDFDTTLIESMIQKYFSPIPAVIKGEPRHTPPVPDYDKPYYTIVTDPELTYNSVTLYYQQESSFLNTEADYRQMIVEQLYNEMFNHRLRELTQTAQPPFIQAFSTRTSMVRARDFYLLGAIVQDTLLETGLRALIREGERVRQHGFTATELERARKNRLRRMEQLLMEKDKTESSRLVSELSRFFLLKEAMPGIDKEFAYVEKYLPGITLEELNQLSHKFISGKNFVITVSMVEKEGVTPPTEKQLEAISNDEKKKIVLPYVDSGSGLSLLETAPLQGRIVENRRIDTLGITIWTLANGIRVMIKPTDFKNDQIVMTAYSPGGLSLIPDSLYRSGVAAAYLVNQSGLGNLNLIALNKYLAGKVVRVSPSIDDLHEGFTGNCSPQELPDLMQMIYLYFMAPRSDSTAFLSFQERYRAFLMNRAADPMEQYSDTITILMSQNQFRSRPWDVTALGDIDIDKAFSIYRQRFADAGDFVFTFAGNVDLETFKPLVETFLGGLPTIKRNDNWIDHHILPPPGIVKKKVIAGIEPQSRIYLAFHGEYPWSGEENYHLNSLAQIMRIRLREIIREEKSGTYGVRVNCDYNQFPQPYYTLSISLGCQPERVEELLQTILGEIDTLRNQAIDIEYVKKVQEMNTRERQTNLKENSYWVNLISGYSWNQRDLMEILEYNQWIANLTPEIIRKTAHTYLNPSQYAQVLLYPREKDEKKD